MTDIQGGFPHNEEQHKVSKEEKLKKKLRKEKKQRRKDKEKIRLLKEQKKCDHRSRRNEIGDYGVVRYDGRKLHKVGQK